jgi:hypothetical protein
MGERHSKISGVMVWVLVDHWRSFSLAGRGLTVILFVLFKIQSSGFNSKHGKDSQPPSHHLLLMLIQRRVPFAGARSHSRVCGLFIATPPFINQASLLAPPNERNKSIPVDRVMQKWQDVPEI